MQKNYHQTTQTSLGYIFIGSLSMGILLVACARQIKQDSGGSPFDQVITTTPFPEPTLTLTCTLTKASTQTFSPTPTPRWADVAWAEQIKVAANSFIRENPDDALKLVQNLDFVREAPGVPPQESVDNSCSPLSASIMNQAGLLYLKKTPLVLNDWWIPDPRDGMPWGLLDMSHYKLYQFLTDTVDGIIGNLVTRHSIPGDPMYGLQNFNFTDFPLCPGDLLYTRSTGSGYDHMVVVSEVDQHNKVWGVTNVPESSSDRFIITRVLLYDPSDLTAGEFKNNFINHHGGTTGMAGFWLLRLNGGCATPPGYDQYLVNP